jgi:hypothetical protein
VKIHPIAAAFPGDSKHFISPGSAIKSAGNYKSTCGIKCRF